MRAQLFSLTGSHCPSPSVRTCFGVHHLWPLRHGLVATQPLALHMTRHGLRRSLRAAAYLSGAQPTSLWQLPIYQVPSPLHNMHQRGCHYIAVHDHPCTPTPPAPNLTR